MGRQLKADKPKVTRESLLAEIARTVAPETPKSGEYSAVDVAKAINRRSVTIDNYLRSAFVAGQLSRRKIGLKYYYFVPGSDQTIEALIARLPIANVRDEDEATLDELAAKMNKHPSTLGKELRRAVREGKLFMRRLTINGRWANLYRLPRKSDVS